MMMIFQFEPLFFIILFVCLIRKRLLASNSFPQILTKSSNQTWNLSSNALLTCHIRDLGDHHVTWFKFDPITTQSQPLAVGEQLFTIDSRFSISSYSTSRHDSFWSLEIYRLNQADEGTYLCKIANRRASVSISIDLHVQVPIYLAPTYLYVEPGSQVKFNCSIPIDSESNRSLSPSISWHFLSNQFNKTKPNDIHTRKQLLPTSFISYLIIQHAQSYHSGIWTCMYKRQRRTARLIVEQGQPNDDVNV
jgi:hypothetical protein